MTDNPLLIADIGGTNARFALASDQDPFFEYAQTLQCADFETIGEAIDTYLENHNIAALQGICFAVAGPIKNQSVQFTNNHWFIDGADLRKRYATDRVQLLNDFESIAYSLAQLGEADLSAIGQSGSFDSNTDFTVGVLGPGSGLGVAGLSKHGGILHPLATEGGHVGFSPDNALQELIMQHLHRKFKRVSNERLISGPGLVNIHEALCEINDKPNPGYSPADIAVAAREQSDPLCMQSMELFFEILGQVAGDTALSLGATDGIYIGGGIAQRYPGQLSRSKFRAAFERKGRYRSRMETIPTWLITHKNPGLLGSSVYARTYL
ncbi:MAG: glucokinase [Gammaproteobacteria bacterium]|nr:glucokinase [Gammaproteobacteria bacterium]